LSTGSAMRAISCTAAKEYLAKSQCVENRNLDAYSLRDFTIIFWSRGPDHPIQFLPEFQEADQLSPVLSFIGLGHVSVTDTSGNETVLQHTATSLAASDPSTWVMRAFSYNGTHACSTQLFTTLCTYMPHLSMKRLRSVYIESFFAKDDYMSEVLMSDIRIFTPSQSVQSLTRRYYAELQHYTKKILDPDTTNFARSEPLDLDMSKYPRKTLGFVPPLIFMRRHVEVPCSGFSIQLSRNIEKLRQDKCLGYECDVDEDLRLQCPGQAMPVTRSAPSRVSEDGCYDTLAGRSCATYYGASPDIVKDGYPVWSKFVHSFSSGSMYRNGDNVGVEDWIDANAQSVAIINLFFTPVLETATLLSINFDLSMPSPKGTYVIEHLPATNTNNPAEQNDTADGLIMALCVVYLVLLLANLYATRQRGCSATQLAYSVAEFSFIGGLFACCLISLRTRTTSEMRLNATFGRALRVPWLDGTVKYHDKVLDYFEAVDDIQSLLGWWSAVEQFSCVLVGICIIRTVAFLAVHPRLNLLVLTISIARDDAIHFLVSGSLVFLGFAALGHIAFGRSVEGFATMEQTVLTQFVTAIAGPDPEVMNQVRSLEGSSLSWLFIVYQVSFVFVICLMLVNFFMALVLDAYNKVKRRMLQSVVEQDIFTDTVSLLVMGFRANWYQWPAMSTLIEKVQQGGEDQDVDADELLRLCGGNSRAAQSLMTHYERYPFLVGSAEQSSLAVGWMTEGLSSLKRHAEQSEALGSWAKTVTSSRAACKRVPRKVPWATTAADSRC